MTNYIKLALIASTTLMASPALGQAFDGPGEQPRNWVATPTIGTVTAVEPADADESGITESQWITTTDGTLDYRVTNYAGPVAFERKFRMRCDPSVAVQMDPILYPGQAGPIGHRHQFTGVFDINPNETYTTSRANPASNCTGGPLNGTRYWEPEMIKTMPNGLVVGVRHQTDTFYYENGLNGQPLFADTWIHKNFAFIGGANPSDFNDTKRRAEYAAGGYTYPNTTSDLPAGNGGWQCYAGSNTAIAVTVSRVASRFNSNTTIARHLKAPDGSDPWGGACTGSNATPGLLGITLFGQQCWDGKNLRAPDGRAHVAYTNSTNKCPDNWVHIPHLVSKKEYQHAGSADYLTWHYASDRMRMASTECPDAAAPCDGVSGGNVPATVGGVSYSRVSHDPCRSTGLDFCAGATGHFDWIYGWKREIFDEMQRECLGVTVRGVAPTNGPAECNTSQISKFRKLLAGGPSPVPALTGGCAITNCSNATPGNLERYNPLAAGTQATITIQRTN